MLVGLLGTVGCYPRAIVRQSASQARITVAQDAPFLVLEVDDPLTTSDEPLARIEIKDNHGFSTSCNYQIVISMAVARARAAGANCLKIDEHMPPDYVSTCHRIKARAYYFADLTPFERRIEWTPTRHLRPVDFKGSPENRPSPVAGVSEIAFSYRIKPFSGRATLRVQTLFLCQRSHFNVARDTAAHMAQQQVLFDIGEVYARRFVQKMEQQVTSLSTLTVWQQQVYNQLSAAWQQTTDHCASDFQKSPATALPKWQAIAQQGLDSLRVYESKTVVLPAHR